MTTKPPETYFPYLTCPKCGTTGLQPYVSDRTLHYCSNCQSIWQYDHKMVLELLGEETASADAG